MSQPTKSDREEVSDALWEILVGVSFGVGVEPSMEKLKTILRKVSGSKNHPDTIRLEDGVRNTLAILAGHKGLNPGELSPGQLANYLLKDALDRFERGGIKIPAS